MPSLDIYQDILCHWDEMLKRDPRIGGRDIKVRYVRKEPEDIEINLLPYVAYFLDTNWEDEAHGTGSYSPQSRRVNLRIGLLLAMMEKDAPSLDKSLFLIGGDLLDLIRENMLWGKNNPELLAKSIIIGRSISWNFEAVGEGEPMQIGAQRISVPMEQFTNFN